MGSTLFPDNQKENEMIQNKKGNKGFTISLWNCHKTIDGGIYIDGKEKEVKFVVRPVEVHSCGKKVMKLIALDKGADMRGNNFKPSTPIYETSEEAEEAAAAYYKNASCQLPLRFVYLTA